MATLTEYTDDAGMGRSSTPINEVIVPDFMMRTRIYIGDSNAASNERILRNYGITHIVNCAAEIPNYFEGAAGDFDFTYLHLGMNDRPESIKAELDKSYKFIRDVLRGQPESTPEKPLYTPEARVLVHCHMGMSRSASVVINYLLHYGRDMTYDLAFKRLKQSRPIVQPNQSYERQLRSIKG